MPMLFPFALIALLQASAPVSTPTKSAPRSIRMEPAVVVDATGFERPMAAATLFVPHGWKTEGGVYWGSEWTCTNGYACRWNASSPDGAERVAILPAERWEWNNYGSGPSTPGCSIAPWKNVRQYLEALVARLQPGARVTGFVAREDLRRPLLQVESRTPMPMGESRTWVEAGEVRATYRENGVERVGSIAAVAVFSLMRNDPGLGTGTLDALNGSTYPAYATSAPTNRHDAALYEAIRASIQTDPQWSQRISGHDLAIGRVALEEGRKRAAAIARSNEEISRIRSEAWEAYSVSADRRARDFADALVGVQTYRDVDAPGGTATLSNSYDHAWRLNDGTYVLSNDSSFDPWRDLKLEGKKLEVGR